MAICRPTSRPTLRELLAIPDDYKVLFLQGGAIGQNAIVPMNLLRGRTRADYVNTGDWAKRSIAEADALLRASTSPRAARRTASPRSRRRPSGASIRGAAYVHICSNETISGLEYHWVPDTGARAAGRRHVVEHPVAADRRLALRPDLRRRAEEHRPGRPHASSSSATTCSAARCRSTPSAFNYTIQAANDSMINTPPTFAIYLAGLVFRWIDEQRRPGGDGRAQPGQGRPAVRAARRQRLLPSTGSPGDDRSLMNVGFHLPDPALDAAFLEGATRGRPAQPQGAPHRRRHARLDLQRDADRGRAGAGRLHEGLRARHG